MKLLASHKNTLIREKIKNVHFLKSLYYFPGFFFKCLESKGPKGKILIVIFCTFTS